MSLGQLNSFTVDGIKHGIKVSDIQYAKQRYKTGVYNDTVLMVRSEDKTPLRRIEIDEQYSDFLVLGLGQFIDVIEIDFKEVESPVALNGLNIKSYKALGTSHTVVIMDSGKRFKIKMEYADFDDLYAGALSFASVDFGNLNDYDTEQDAKDDETLEEGAFFRINGSIYGTIKNNIMQKILD